MAVEITTQEVSITSLTTEVAVLKEQIRALKELMAERDRYHQDALRLQAAEYERRLADLNHSHQRALAVQATFVSREVYDGYVASQLAAAEVARREQQKWRDDVKSELDTNRGAAMAQTRTMAQIIAFAGLAMTTVVFVITYVIR